MEKPTNHTKKKKTDDIFAMEEEQHLEENMEEETKEEDEENEDSQENMEEEKLFTQEELEIKLTENPNCLETTILLLETYKANKQTNKLIQLRSEAQKNLMLPEVIWLEWLDEELKSAVIPEKKKEVLKLFEKALEDFDHFIVAKKYCKYAILLYNEKILTKTNIKSIFEKLICIFCNDFLKGSNFFTKYRKFESKQNPQKDAKIQQDIEKNIRNLYNRQFQLPLADIDLAWENYAKWEKDQNELSKMKEIRTKTYKILEEIVEIEDKFQEALEANSLEKINEFIALVKENTALSFVKKLNYIERILAEYPSEVELWRTYLNYLNLEIKTPGQLYKYYRRACKCCIEEIDLCRKYLRILSKISVEPQEFEGELTKLLNRFSGVNDKYLLWQTACEYYINRAHETCLTKGENGKKIFITNDVKSINKENMVQLRDIFTRAIDFFETTGKKDENSLFSSELELIWGSIETYLFKDKVEMNKILEKYIRNNGDKAEAWINYLNLELMFNNISSCRSLMKRANEYVKENIESILSFQIDFERKFGNIDDLEKAEEKLTNFLLKKEEETGGLSRKTGKIQKGRIKLQSKYASNKRKHLELEEEEDLEPELEKRLKNEKKSAHQKFKDTKNTVYVKNFPLDMSEAELINMFSNKKEIISCRMIKDKLGNPKGFAYIDFVTPEAAQESLCLNGEMFKGKKLLIAISEPPKTTRDDRNTLFINNLPYSVTEQMIIESMKEYKDRIKAIRIIRDQNDRPKGYGYIEFNNQVTMLEACEKYHKKLEIDHKKVDLSPADTTKNLQQSRNLVVFLNNLAFNVTEEDIKQFFSEHPIEKIEITKNARGISRGFGFVEFKSLKDLSLVLEKKTGVLKGREFTIDKSKREITQKQKVVREAIHQTLSKKDAVDVTEEKEKKEKKEVETKGPMKSNDDFRKMFLK